MASTSGLLSLKWNNHRSTFFHVLSNIRVKESYSDVTIACDGKFFQLHKFVLATCSEYFEEIFQTTTCKHPVIVLKDIKQEDLEALLCYMYLGEVNVIQEKLSCLINAAEYLKIKGLAVPDEDPVKQEKQKNGFDKKFDESPKAKKRKTDFNHASNNYSNRSHTINRTNSTNSENTFSNEIQEVSLIEDHKVKEEDIETDVQASESNSQIPGIEEVKNLKQSHEITDEQWKHNEHQWETEGDVQMEEDGLSMLPSTSSDTIGNTPSDEQYSDKMVKHSSHGLLRHNVIELRNNVSASPPDEGGSSQEGFFMHDYDYHNTEGISQDLNNAGRIKSFKCPFCNYNTFVKTNYTTHLRTHTGERPYQCDVCGYKSSQRSNLKVHMLRHQRP